jgi:hypothetical protein
MSRWPYVIAFVIACSRSEETAAPQARDDRQPIPTPAVNKNTHVSGWWTSLGSLTEPTRARGVTALDEVPDSTWFTNRNAVRPLSLAEIRRGPAQHRAPRDGQRWTVIGMKQTGVALGLRARDEAGDAFFLKFDPLGHDEVETGADVVVQRLLFAAGYNVPENDVVYLTRTELAAADDVKPEDIDALLARAAREPDGRYRAVASRFLPGEPVGGIMYLGTRKGDVNDQIPHEDRRDMRGLYTLAAWVNHTDMKPANTLDVWVPTSPDSSRGYVVHYLLDFGKALGAMTRIDGRFGTGFSHSEDPDDLPWQEIGPFPDLRGLGFIESERFDPSNWKPLVPWLPFEKADRFDKLWGARLVASFTPPQIRAAVEAGRYSDLRTVEHLTRVLVERQRKTIAHLFRGVAPLAHFEMRRGDLCFVDLWTRHGLGGETTYTVGSHRGVAKPDGTVCFDLPREVPPSVEIEVERAGLVLPSTRVTLAGSPPCVTAIERR